MGDGKREGEKRKRTEHVEGREGTGSREWWKQSRPPAGWQRRVSEGWRAKCEQELREAKGKCASPGSLQQWESCSQAQAGQLSSEDSTVTFLSFTLLSGNLSLHVFEDIIKNNPKDEFKLRTHKQNQFAIHLKLTQHCKSTMLPKKKVFFHVKKKKLT